MNISQKLNKCKSIFLFIFSILSFILTFYSYEIADRLNLDSAWRVFRICQRLEKQGKIK